jgi:hypothetical protein
MTEGIAVIARDRKTKPLPLINADSTNAVNQKPKTKSQRPKANSQKPSTKN